MISSEAIKLIVKDKDMFFDDLIGSALLNPPAQQLLEEKAEELVLISEEEENRKDGNGVLKVFTSPVSAKFNL